MRSPPLPGTLNLWTRSTDRLPQPLRQCVWDRHFTVLRGMHGVKLPRRLVFLHSPCSRLELQHLGSPLLAGIPAPQALKSYVRVVTVFAAKNCSAAGDVLCTKGTTLTWEQVKLRAHTS